jgi:hypothetical protein
VEEVVTAGIDSCFVGSAICPFAGFGLAVFGLCQQVYASVVVLVDEGV